MPNPRITVIPNDIKVGIPHEGCHCPIAVATRRTFPDATFICASKSELVIRNKGGSRINYRYPECAKVFMRTFDANLPVEPITFEVEEIL